MKFWLIACCLALGASAFAQAPATSGQSEVQMPEIAAPSRPSPDEATGLMSGDKPFSLTTDPSGELMYNFDDNRELESITAKRGVVFTSEDMTLNSDQLDYNTQTSELVASGERVVVRQGEVVATCKLFKYYPNDQHSELSGNPILYNKTRDGKVHTTAGEKIMIYTVNGKPSVKVMGGKSAPRISSSGQTPVLADSNAKLTVTDQGVIGAPSGALSGSSVAPAPVATQTPSGSGSRGGLSLPSLSGPQDKEKQSAPKSNRIDPNNPADVESFTGKTEKK